MEIRTLDLSEAPRRLDQKQTTVGIKRASRIVEFVEHIAQRLLLSNACATEVGLKSIGCLSLEKLKRPGSDGVILLQGELRLQNSLETQRHALSLSNKNLHLLAEEFGFTMDTIEAVEISKFAGYGMYSVRHHNQDVEAVLYDATSGKMEYEVWKVQES